MGEALRLAGIQLASSGCSMGRASRASCLSVTALAPSGFLSLLLLLLLLFLLLLRRALGFCFFLCLGLGLGFRLFLRWSRRGRWGGSGRARGNYDLVLALSVGDDRAQQQGDDCHEVEVPLRA